MIRPSVWAMCLYLLFICVACTEETPTKNATVLGESADCGWLMQFYEKPADLPESHNNIYIMVNDNQDYQLTNVEAFVEARPAIWEEETLSCRAVPVYGYVQIFVEKIEY